MQKQFLFEILRPYIQKMKIFSNNRQIHGFGFHEGLKVQLVLVLTPAPLDLDDFIFVASKNEKNKMAFSKRFFTVLLAI